MPLGRDGGVTIQNGYGHVSHEGRLWRANRFAWAMEHGPISDGWQICHDCDNPPCVNPAHLYLCTQADNRRDAVTP